MIIDIQKGLQALEYVVYYVGIQRVEKDLKKSTRICYKYCQDNEKQACKRSKTSDAKFNYFWY